MFIAKRTTPYSSRMPQCLSCECEKQRESEYDAETSVEWSDVGFAFARDHRDMAGVERPTSPSLGPRLDVPPSPRNSGFVLLTTAGTDALVDGNRRPHLGGVDGATSSPVSGGCASRLARPRCAPVLQLAAGLDLVTTAALAYRVPVAALPASTLVINLARSVVVGLVACSSRIRELGPVILAQVAVRLRAGAGKPSWERR